MKTTQLRILSDAAGRPAASARRSGRSHVFRNLIVVPADTGEEAVALAAADLRKYLKLACPGSRVTVKNGAVVSGDDLRGNSLILLGNANTNGLIRRTQQAARLTYRISYRERYREITGVPLKDPGAGFSVRTMTSPYSRDHTVILLEGEDKLGVQYAAYDWLEKAVGVRFLSPYFEYCPQRKDLRIPRLNYEETCNFPLRRLEVWGYPTDVNDHGTVRGPVRTRFDHHGNDPWLWYRNGLNGDITMMTRCVDWLVKNKQNVITWLPEMFGHWPPEVPMAYARYEAMRGLKIIGYSSAGSVWLPLKHYESVYGDIRKSLCQSARGESFHHPCFTKKLYWDILEKEIAWYEKPANRVRQMVAFTLCYEEGNCAYPAYCMKDRPAVPCKYCGTIPNWKKWVASMKKVEERLQAKGWNVPVGRVDFGSGSSGIPWDDDHRFGVRPEWDRQLVDHAPSRNNFFELRPPGDHTWEEMEHYWNFVKRRNRRAKLRLSVLKQGENVLMMSTDLPLISPYYFKARQHDFDRLSGDSVTFGHDVNLYTTRKLEWLKTHYSFRGQWKHAGTWEQSVAGEVDHLFGDGVGARTVDALKFISRVLEQDLVWRKTPYNRDTPSYRGIQTFFPSLVHIFTNCAQHPLDLMELRGGNGGVWNMAASGPEEVRLKRRPYRDFVDRDYRMVKRDMLHYLKLLAQAEESLRTAAHRIQRNRDFFEEEFAYNLRGALDFLGWRLKAVTAYCLLIEAEKHARRYDQQTTLATMRQALAHMSEAVQTLQSYWKRYGVKEELIERSWGEASPAPRQVEALHRVWQKLDEATRGDGPSWNTALIRYVNVTDRYPDLFSNQPRVVGKKNDLFGCSLFTQIGEDKSFTN